MARSRSRGPRPTGRRAAYPRLRRWLAAGLAAVTVAVAMYVVLNRPAPEDVPALVTRSAVPLGQPLKAGDVEVQLLPPQALPAGALASPDDVVGRVVVAPLVAREVITPVDVSTAGLLTGQPEGTVAVFVPVAEPSVPQALNPADRVDVHSPVDGQVVVPAALVLRTSIGEDSGLWLAVDPDGARAIATARGADPAGAALQIAVRPADG